MKTILVVDDSEQNRTLLQDVLQFSGFAVLLAANGAEGVRLAREHLPDLILMDLQMPVMNGLEAGRQLRADPQTKDVKILAMSAVNLLPDEDDFFVTGFDGHLPKPFDILNLAAIIRQYLGEVELS